MNDEHWRPQYALCNYCKVKFDYVARFEDIIQDDGMSHIKRYLEPKWRPEDDEQFSAEFPKFPIRAGYTKRNMTADEITLLHFETLDDEYVEKLYEIYAIDFETLGYTFSFRNKTYPP